MTREIEANETADLNRFFAAVKCMKRLNEIANRDGSLTPLQCINKKKFSCERGRNGRESQESQKTRLSCVIHLLKSM